VQGYYRNAIRSSFVAHADEEDPERLQHINEQALKDADWVVEKVGGRVGGGRVAVGTPMGALHDTQATLPLP
jgi:hypothetical protein